MLVSDNDDSIPNIEPLFITVDPERDDVKALSEYCKGGYWIDPTVPGVWRMTFLQWS